MIVAVDPARRAVVRRDSRRRGVAPAPIRAARARARVQIEEERADPVRVAGAGSRQTQPVNPFAHIIVALK